MQFQIKSHQDSKSHG
uniref:Protein TPR3-like n=1 Tax=Rhizophora mucronata TaxID=61149 RepID=A0A2P2JNU2_RHIMU